MRRNLTPEEKKSLVQQGLRDFKNEQTARKRMDEIRKNGTAFAITVHQYSASITYNPRYLVPH